MTIRWVYLLLLTIWSASASSQGLKLFSPEIKEAVPKNQKVVMDFLERYFYDLSKFKQTARASVMAEDKVYFRKGDYSDLTQICDTMPFSINLHDKYYEVNWQRETEPFVTIVFPAQFELLSGLKKDEAMEKFKEAVLVAPPREQIPSIPLDLQQVNDSLYCSKGDTLLLAEMTDALYYNKVREDFIPVFDRNYLDLSAANLFHGLIQDSDYRMYVEQSVFGMKTIDYTITFSQWLNYCAEWGLKVFFAVEEVREDGVLALVIAKSPEFGYHHLLSVVVPDKFITDHNAVLKVRLTPYIPVHNVKDLYKKEVSNRKKIKWQ